ncbi:metal-sulfur cluster biosynthetic enzyme [Ameyamaea chiangmaiensis NBRC 103196]|uniref:SUF system Fe-S cluster assembly protein n=1 Tax=Ameyamaea chiangmaiensis TaxID=442969 RepID=A0A850PIS4_9PROT|nr:SUF system Fe-S cluster assembly protein [Ameyamaea chiangmaiensis]MBS4074525.1 SUF system Fe-S cluster assembly protein [Ameyamaea chiangmaiensis]NVN41161.1 SUF system Fe-S cluster assembly protein [Ameyamaea chiangmaiensis]GBQ72368.1 metal-sulfur cluster biosynthetic enzyme [Ameyamaea chiangmaiensis NBRC 103196]
MVDVSSQTAQSSGFPVFATEGDGPSAVATGTRWTPDGEEAVTPGIADEDKVIEAIATVFDPEIPVNIYELGLIYAIDLHEDGRVKIEMTLTAPNCPSAQELPEQVRDAVASVEKVRGVEVDIVWDPPWDMSRMSDDARLALNMF